MSTTERGFWTGVAEVIPRSGNELLEGADGAYVSIVGLMSSKPEFMENAKIAFDAMDFDVLEVADVEFISSPEQWIDADQIMRERVATLSPKNPIECGSFHCYRD